MEGMDAGRACVVWVVALAAGRVAVEVWRE